jgi:LPXTG-motif cell wall-anchored protein
MGAVKVIGWALLGWFLGALVVSLGLSLILASMDETNIQLENTIGGLAGLAGAIGGLVFGIRRRRAAQQQ